MNVLLVVPPFSSSPSGHGAKIRPGKLRPLPPLGLGYLAAVLEQHGHHVQLIDAQARQWSIPKTVDAIVAAHPDVVGISIFTVYMDCSFGIAAAVRARAPEISIAMGGPHATAFHEAILRECAAVDYVVPGEAEYSFAALLDALAAGTPLSVVNGIVFRTKGGEIMATPPAEFVREIDTLPHPERRIFSDQPYIPLPNQSRRKPATTVMTSRGCPWAQCRFCYQGGKYGAPYRRRSPENVVDELRYLRRTLGFREVIFWDDNFCVNEKWITRFCDLLDTEKLDLTWTVQGRVNTVTPTMLERIAASGCYNIFLGFESGNQELLDLIDKGITLEQSRNAVVWANRAGLEVRGAFMFALPTETPEMAEKTIRFACELDVDFMVFSPFHIQRGTPIEARALQEGHVVPVDADAFDWHIPSYIPNAYTGPEHITGVLREAYRRFYLRPRYIRRALWRSRNPIVLRNYLHAFAHWLVLARFGRVE